MVEENKYYTVTKRQDGFGAQFQYYIWQILYTELNGGKFIMPKITEMEHNYNNDPNFIDNIRKFMNLENRYSELEAFLKKESINYLNIKSGYQFVENNIDYCLNSNVLKNIKNLFWSNKNKNSIYQENDNIDDYYNIAVHIRRPNKHDGNNYKEDTKIGLNYYKEKINESCEKYLFTFGLKKKKPIRIFIYSQGDKNNFDEFLNIAYGEVILKVDEDMFSSFLGIAISDVLIMSPSSFSYIAAFLCNGEIYYYPFWHNSASSWNIPKDIKPIQLNGYTNWIK